MPLTPATLCPLSLEYVLDAAGRPIVGALLTVFAAGTLQPAVAFADAELTSALQQPVKTTGTGRFPPVYVGQGYFRYRVTDPLGAILDDIDGVQGAVVTQVTQEITSNGFIAPPGSLLHFYGAETPDGWVRANGKTIGNAVSGATEFGDPSTAALFVALWDADPNLVVSSGRGNTAVGDYNQGKTIALPDLRRRALIGLDGMGNGYLNFLGLNTDPFRILGSTFGEEVHTLSIAEMPTHNHPAVNDVQGGHIHQAACDIQGMHTHAAVTDLQGIHTHAATMDVQGDHTHSASIGQSGAHQHQASADTQGDHNHQYTRTHYNNDGPVNSNYSTFVRETEVNDDQNTSNAGAHTHNISMTAAGLHTHDITIQNNGAHQHNITVQNAGQHGHNITVQAAGAHQHNITIADAGEHTHTITMQTTGGSAAHNNMQPSMPVTILIKL